MGSVPAWCYRLAKPFSTGGHSALLEARSLAAEGVESQRREHLFCQGSSKKRHIAITFNDGPHPEVTPDLLELLQQYQMPATFFMIGREALSHVELAKQLTRNGHEVGNHTMNHVRCSEESERELFRQIQDAQDAIRFASGEEARWFRPPFGDFDEAQLHLPFRSRLSTVYWTTKVKDWEEDDAGAIVRQVKQGLAPGAIISLHEKNSCVVDAMKQILEDIQAADLKPVTLSEMFASEQPKFR
ncbi:MAG: polysaccharide deacetylase family protein [Verrucomicrobiota bacterium]